MGGYSSSIAKNNTFSPVITESQKLLDATNSIEGFLLSVQNIRSALPKLKETLENRLTEMKKEEESLVQLFETKTIQHTALSALSKDLSVQIATQESELASIFYKLSEYKKEEDRLKEDEIRLQDSLNNGLLNFAQFTGRILASWHS